MERPDERALGQAQRAWCLGSTLMEQHILHLHHEHQMSYGDIARRVGMSVDVVVTTCFRYKEKNLANH